MRHARFRRDADRLPWLDDTIAPVRASQLGWLQWLLIACIAALCLALVSYMIGRGTYQQPDATAVPAQAAARLKQPKPVRPQPDSTRPEKPAIELAPSPWPERVEKVRLRHAEPARPVPEQADSIVPTAPATPATPPAASEAQLAMPARVSPTTDLWPAAISDGASGRVARIGTFATRHKAKVAWTRLVRLYPGIRRLRAVVAPVPSLRNGRIYYRLQFGTTSQAHSEVLCQRMRIIGQSCVVVGV